MHSEYTSKFSGETWKVRQAWSRSNESKLGYQYFTEQDTEKLQHNYWTGPLAEIEYDPRGYPIAYRMASDEPVEMITERWSPRSPSGGYHGRRTSLGDREDYHQLYWTKPLTKMLTTFHSKGSRNYGWKAYLTECQTTFPEGYEVTTEKPTNILPTLPPQMTTEMSTENAPKLSSEWLSPRNGSQRPCRIKRCRDLHMQGTKQLSKSRSAPVTVSMTIYCEPYVLDMDQWYTAHARWNWPPFYHLRMAPASQICEPTDMTIPAAEAHITIQSQDRFKSWFTFPDITQANSNNGQCQDTTLWSKSRIILKSQLHARSPINPNSDSVIEVTLLPSHNGNRQSIWLKCHWQSKEFSKSGR